MANDSPAVIIFGTDGYEVSVRDNIAIENSTDIRGLLIAGSDGYASHHIRTDSDGQTIIVGSGTAGTPLGGILTVQGDSSGTPIPISGTITVDIGTTNGLALDATLSKLTIPQDTLLGSNTQALVGGSVAVASPTYTAGNINPFSLTTAGALRVDGSAVTQPVSGTVAATQSGTWTVQPGNTANTTPWLTTISQGGNSATVTASNALKVDGSAVTQPISGTITANIGTTGGLALDATLTGGTQTTRITDGTNTATVKAASTAAVATDKALVVAVSPNNTITTTNASIGINNTTVPTSSTLVGGSDGYNLRPLSVDAEGHLRIDIADSAAVSAFSRLRIANPYSLFSNKQIFDNQPLYWDDQQTAGGSTSSTFLTNKAATQLTVTNNVSGTRVRQSFRRMNYQSGKGQLCLFTGVLVNEGGPGNAAVNRRIGLFDESNGFYFELTGTTMNVAIRTFTSGSAVSTKIPQSSWNIDKLDGTTISGITLDVSKAQIFVVDFQWLGVGRIRYGFDIDGIIVYCHEILIANNQSLVSISNPNLPVRYEIQSLGTGAATTSSMQHICATVISEGGQEDVGFTFGVDTGATTLTTGNNTNVYTLLAVQLKSGYLSATVEPTFFSVVSATASAQFKVSLILNPSVAGTALSYTGVTNSALQYALGVANNLVTGGTVIYSAYFQNSKVPSGGGSDRLTLDVSLGSSIAGVSDTLVLAVQPTPAQATQFLGSFNWKEQI